MMAIMIICLLQMLMIIPASAKTTEVVVEPTSPADIKPGQELSVNININNGAGVSGYDLSLFFSPQVLEAVRVNEGNFLNTAGPTSFSPGVIANDKGSVTDIRGTLQGGALRTGTGMAVTVFFRVKTLGSSELRIGEPKLYGKDSMPYGTVQGISSNFSISNAPPSAENDPSQHIVVKEKVNPHQPAGSAPTMTQVQTGSNQIVAVGPQAWVQVFKEYGGKITGNSNFLLILGGIIILLFIFVAFRMKH